MKQAVKFGLLLGALFSSQLVFAEIWQEMRETFERLDPAAVELPKVFESYQIKIDSTKDIVITGSMGTNAIKKERQKYTLTQIHVADLGDTNIIVEGVILKNESSAGDCSAATKSELKIILNLDKNKLRLSAKPIIFGNIGRTLDWCHLPMRYSMVPYSRKTDFK